MKLDLLQTALDCGAAKAAYITADQIVMSADFRKICEENGCGMFGRCWMCPPHIGNIDELMAQVRSFPKAMLYQSIREIEDSFDIEGMFEAGYKHAQLSQKIHQQVMADDSIEILHLSCGGCRLCETCAKASDEPCRFPDKALPSLEGYGIDVYHTCKDTPLNYINGQNTVTYFGMVLYREN